jgi:putative membrane protein
MSFWLKFTNVAAVGALILLTGCGESTTKTSSDNTPGAGSTNTSVSRVSDSGSTATTTPEAFVREAAQANMAETELGKLASTKAQNPDVQKFARTMVDDHSANLQMVKDLANKKNFTVPTDLPEKEKSELARLEKMSGADFDRAYMNSMVKDHEQDVALFEKVSNTSTDSDVKAYATETLPTLQHHLQMAKDANNKVQGGNAAMGESKTGEPVEVRHDTSTSKATGTSTAPSR